MSYGSDSRFSPTLRKKPSRPSAPYTTARSRFTGRPNDSYQSSSALCVSGIGIPSSTPIPYAKNDSGRCAVIFGSSWRRLPAAALRGFANSRCSAARWRSFRRAKSRLNISTSPRTSSRAGTCAPFSFSGIERIVRTFSVTSSPVVPSPRVDACTNTPCS